MGPFSSSIISFIDNDIDGEKEEKKKRRRRQESTKGISSSYLNLSTYLLERMGLVGEKEGGAAQGILVYLPFLLHFFLSYCCDGDGSDLCM